MNVSDMAAVSLAGGRGTRISEYTDTIQSLWYKLEISLSFHIIDSYVHQGVKKFYIAGGYKIEELKKYFAQYHLLNSDFCLSIKDGGITILGSLTKTFRFCN